MQTFTYSFFAKLIYRFANFPITIILIFYIFVSLWGFTREWFYSLPLFINLIILFLLNRYYFRSYKIFPYKIIIDNEIMICSDFFFSDKRIELKLSDISDLKGGIFSGHPSRPIYIFSEKHDLKIGINQHIKGYNKLLTIILQNITQPLYSKLLETMKDQFKLPERVTRKKKK